MSKNVLVSVTGKVPQVMTEAMWYFLTKKKIVFDRLVIITTEAGEDVILKGNPERRFPKFLGANGMLDRFCEEYAVQQPKHEIIVITDRNGQRLRDIKKSEEFEAAAYRILDTIRTQQRDDLYCIFSGGRRLMASYLMSALTLVGKSNHRLFYIGLDPQDVDTQPMFFFPPRKPVVLDLPSGKRMTDQIDIEAVEVVFPRLGEKYAEVTSKDRSYLSLVNHIQSYLSLEKKPIINVYGSIDREPRILGEDPKLKEGLSELKVYAERGLSPVLVYGETGSGKELFAQHYHYWYQMSRSDRKPMVVINCAAVPPGLLESELFGYFKGAFTGADADRPGKLEQADGGVAFLDEINSAPPEIQAALLRFLENGELQKVGTHMKNLAGLKRVNVKIILATNQDLDLLVEQGKFREDFFQRAANPTVFVPPLRERRKDIPLLVDHFLETECHEAGKGRLVFSDDLLQEIVRMDWNGNVRELRRFIQTTVLLTNETSTITTFPKKPLSASRSRRPNEPMTYESILRKVAGNEFDGLRLRERVEAFEKWMLTIEFDNHKGNAAQLAEALDTPESTIKDKLKKYGLT